MLYWPVLLITVMLCMAVCVCVCKRGCYINLFGNKSPTCQHTHAHTHAWTHAHKISRSVHTVILESEQCTVWLVRLAQLSVSLSMLYFICLLRVFNI